jgi:AraC-like DNA-binding protein
MSLLRADFTTHNYGPHTHEAFVIAVTEAGGAEISNARCADRVTPSALFVSNPEERQSARMGDSKRWVYRSIYLTLPAMGFIARELVGARLGVDAAPCFASGLIDDAGLIDAFGRMHRALEADGNGPGDDFTDGFLARELMIDAFGALFRRHGSGGGRLEAAPHDRVIAGRVIELMRARYDENLGLDELAGAAGLTNFQLIGLFNRTVGLTPHAYLVHLRLNAACRHLKRGHTLAESAQAAGFCDQSALTNHFKRHYGITPLQFAEAVRSR